MTKSKSKFGGLAVLITYRGNVHQVKLNKSDELRVEDYLNSLFISTGRNFELIEEPITGIELRRHDRED